MSPIIAGPGSASKDFKRESTVARLLGSGSAGIAELAVFHPVCWLHLSGGDNRGQAEERRGHPG